MILRWLLPALISISCLLLYISNKGPDQVSIIQKTELALQKRLQMDSAMISRYLMSDNDKSILSGLDLSPFSIEVYHHDSIQYWNNPSTQPFSFDRNNLLLLRTKDTTSYGIIKFNLNAFNQSTSLGQSYFLQLDPEGDNGHPLHLAGKKLSASIKALPSHIYLKSIAWILLFISFLILSVRMLQNLKSGEVANNRKVMLALSAILIGFKGLHYVGAFTHLFEGLDALKTTNDISLMSPSIAHLIINLWIFGVLIYILNQWIPSIKTTKKFAQLISFVAGFYTFFIFGVAVALIEGFVIHPDVNLEIEDLMTFDHVSFVLVLCFSALMILIFQSTQMLYEWVNSSPETGWAKWGYIITGWLCAWCMLYLTECLHVPVWIFICFIAAYTLILDAYSENRDKKITYLIWWLIMFSGFLAVTLFYFGLKKDISDRQQFLTNYYVQPADSTVQSLSVLQDSLLAGDVFNKIASLETSSKLDMKDLYQFIFKKSKDEANGQYISIELFDKKSGASLFNNHFSDYYKLNQTYENARRVGKNVFHNPFEDLYIIRLEIARSFPYDASWYLFIIQKGNSHANKLLSKKDILKYGYAVFSHDKLIEKSENLQSTPEAALLATTESNSISGGYSLVVSSPSDQYKIVSWKKVSGLIKPISLFSFIFTLSGLLLLLISLINTKFDFLPSNISLKFGSRSSLKTKIQLAIILLILVTFLIIGAITGFYFKNLIEVNQNAKNKEETNSVINNIRSDIQNIADDEYAMTYLNSKLKDLSFVHDKELSLYDAQGKLMSSTMRGEPDMRIPFRIWDQTSERKMPVSSYKLDKKENREFIPIYLAGVMPFAYIGVDHTSYNNSSGSILDFLSTILNAYIFLFLIAGAIAITIANSITQPLTILAEKLKKFKLGKTNELLEWKSNDEIGTLIHDYNNLTQELEKSAGLLAKTERDMAWREMAKQVAHEIKNPLTPMKLSIQYLDRATKDQPEKAMELIPRISSTLIEQIDNLSQIANEFSNFASMPQASNEKIILNEIVETIHDLFRKRDDMDINMIEPIDDLYVFADKNHLVRILNNLLKNAIQAIPENRRGRIEIELKRHENNALIRISDNGTGIPDHMKDKVFTPNFTTKSSGTGLGLAISANMIESFNGRIYFETRVGQGTDFYISIPLMRLDEYLDIENRVSLD